MKLPLVLKPQESLNSLIVVGSRIKGGKERLAVGVTFRTRQDELEKMLDVQAFATPLPVD